MVYHFNGSLMMINIVVKVFLLVIILWELIYRHAFKASYLVVAIVRHTVLSQLSGGCNYKAYSFKPVIWHLWVKELNQSNLSECTNHTYHQEFII